MTDSRDFDQFDHNIPKQQETLLSRLNGTVPEAFQSGKLDAEALQALLGD